MPKTSSPQQNPILLVAQPGLTRSSLALVLSTSPALNIVGQVDNSPAVLEAITAHHPKLVLLDTDLPSSWAWPEILEQIKTNWPQLPCLILIITREQQQAAQRAGADIVLNKVMTTVNICAYVEKLCNQPW